MESLCLLEGTPGNFQAGIEISVAHLFYMRVNLDGKVVNFAIEREGESARSAFAIFLSYGSLNPAAFTIGNLHLVEVSGLFAISHRLSIDSHGHLTVLNTKTCSLFQRRIRHGSLVFVGVPEVYGYIVSTVGNFIALCGCCDGTNHYHGCEGHNDGKHFGEYTLFQVDSSFQLIIIADQSRKPLFRGSGAVPDII